jgi:hypothetical protein
MSVLEVVTWVVVPLVGVALGLRMRSTALALLLGFLLFITAVVLWGYSVDHYSNNDCQLGEPCPTGDRVIRVVNAVFVPLGPTLFLTALARSLWNDFREGRWPGQRGRGSMGRVRKSD